MVKDGSILIQGITLFDGTDNDPTENAAILIEDGKFAKISAGQANEGSAATVIDGRGKFAMPGLMDANVHLLDGMAIVCEMGGIEYLARYEGRYKECCEEAAQFSLKYGTTTLFDTGNAYRPITSARDSINAGDVVGARIFCAGNIIGSTGPFGTDNMYHGRKYVTSSFANRIDELYECGVGGELLKMDIEDVADRVQAHVETDIDFAKIFVSDHLVSALGHSTAYFSFSERVLRRIFEIVQSKGLKVVTHTTHLESLNLVVDMGADVMVHHNNTSQMPIPEYLIQKLAAFRGWGAPQPVTSAFQKGMESIGHNWARYGGGHHQRNLERLIEAGANLCLATDAVCSNNDLMAHLKPEEREDRPWDIGKGSVRWLAAMVESGMSPSSALKAGTRDVAIAYGVEDRLGTVEPGKIADILILDANPVADVRNVEKLRSVIKGGAIIDTSALPDNPIVTLDRTYD